MEISTVYTCQDTENECDTETEQCGGNETQQCDHAEETEQWLSEDYYRQRCEGKDVLQNSDCSGAKRMENVE